MRHPDYPDFICDISEPEFWKQLRVRRNCVNPGLLRTAIKHGLAGEKKNAYETLAAYYQQSLQGEWEHLQQHGPPAAIHCCPTQTADDVVRHYLSYSPSACRQYDKIVDWNEPATGSILDSFYWYIPLVRAYLADPREDYREALGDLIKQYYAVRNHRRFSRPYYHPVYTALSASLKLRHILPGFLALAAREVLDAETTEAFLKLALGIARSLYRRETHFQLTNQTVTNAAAFGQFASWFPEFAESPAFRQRTIARTLGNVEKGFLPDGGYYERSFSYFDVAIIDSTAAIAQLERAAPLPPAIRRRFEKVFRAAARFWVRSLAPGGYCPPYADGNIHKGTATLRCLQRFAPRQPQTGSYLFPQTGFAVCRSEDAYLFFSFAQSDLWHSHQDCLTFDFWHGGRPLLLESGRFGLYDHPLSRLFRMPEMHNTLTVDGQTWDERRPELWRGEDVRWRSTPDFDYITATHRAYRGDLPVSPQAQDYRLRRSLVFVKKAGYVIVHDSVDNHSKAPVGIIAQHWHAPTPFHVIGAGCVKADGVLIQTLATETLRRTETGTDYLPEENAEKNAFPARYRASFRRWADSSTSGPQGFVTLIMPFENTPPTVELKVNDVTWQTDLVTVKTPTGTDEFLFKSGRGGRVKLQGQASVNLP